MIDQLKVSNRSDKSELLFTKVISTFSSRLGLLVFSTIAQIFLARFLGPNAYGTFSLTIITAILISTVFHFSLSHANLHFSSQFPALQRSMVGNSIFFGFFWGLLVTAGIMVLKHIVPDTYQPHMDYRLWGMVLVAVIPLLLFEMGGGMAITVNWIKRFSLFQSLRDLILVIAVCYLGFRDLLSVETAMSTWIIAIVAVVLLQLISNWWRIGSNIDIDPNLLIRMISHGIIIHIVNVFTLLRLRADWFLIDYFMNPQDLGYYSVACIFIAVLWYLPTVIAKALKSFISIHAADIDGEITSLFSRLAFSVSVTGAVLLAVFGYWLIPLLVGGEFRPAYMALLLLLPGGVIMSIAHVTAGDFFARGRFKFNLIIATISLFINIAINLFFIPRFGILGAAAAATITQFLLGMIYLFFFNQLYGVSPGAMLLLRRSDIQMILGSRRS